MTAPSPGPTPDEDERRVLRRRILELEQQLAAVPELHQELEDERARATQLDAELQATLAALHHEQAARALDEQERAELQGRLDALQPQPHERADGDGTADARAEPSSLGSRLRTVARRTLGRSHR